MLFLKLKQSNTTQNNTEQSDSFIVQCAVDKNSLNREESKNNRENKTDKIDRMLQTIIFKAKTTNLKKNYIVNKCKCFCNLLTVCLMFCVWIYLSFILRFSWSKRRYFIRFKLLCSRMKWNVLKSNIWMHVWFVFVMWLTHVRARDKQKKNKKK